MRFALVLITLLISSISLADTFYVKKTATGTGVSAADGVHVREALQNAISSAGHNIAKTAGDARVALRAVINKADGSGYVVKVEKYRQGQLQNTVEAQAGSPSELVASARRAAESFVSSATSQVDANNKSDVVVENYPSENRTVSAEPNVVSQNSSVEARHPNYVKNWFVGLGPVLSTNLQGANGTKYAVLLAYAQGMSERINMRYFYAGDFNTASQGSTAVTEIGVAGDYFISDRGADTSFYVSLDLGYGGGNKLFDAGPVGGIGAGFQFFRTKEFTAQAGVRLFGLYSGNASLQSMPNDTEVILGIYF